MTAESWRKDPYVSSASPASVQARLKPGAATRAIRRLTSEAVHLRPRAGSARGRIGPGRVHTHARQASPGAEDVGARQSSRAADRRRPPSRLRSRPQGMSALKKLETGVPGLDALTQGGSPRGVRRSSPGRAEAGSSREGDSSNFCDQRFSAFVAPRQTNCSASRRGGAGGAAGGGDERTNQGRGRCAVHELAGCRDRPARKAEDPRSGRRRRRSRTAGDPASAGRVRHPRLPDRRRRPRATPGAAVRSGAHRLHAAASHRWLAPAAGSRRRAAR